MKLILHNRKSEFEYKYEIRFPFDAGEKVVYFGKRSETNYLDVCDKRKSTYLSEEIDRENIKNVFRDNFDKSKLNVFYLPETMEYYILYNKCSLRESVDDYKRKFGLGFIKRIR